MSDFQIRIMRAGVSGKDAWTPVIAIAQDGFRLVMKIINWVGGEGEKPVCGLYIGPEGYVDEISKAVDVRGVGQKGWSPVLSVINQDGKSALQVFDWVGGEGEKPETGLYIGLNGLVDDMAAAIDIKGQQGLQGIQGIKGDKGEIGPQGLQGLQGPKGDKGDKGDTGPIGPAGPTSAAGSITNAMLVTMPANTLKGAVAAGVAQDLTGAQVRQIIGLSLLDLVPIGTPLDWPYTKAPDGYLLMQGQLLSRTTYAALWAFVQANARLVTDAAWLASDWGTFSTGDGSTTFRLPDPRGEFIRVLDGGRGVDAGRALGGQQLDAFKAHSVFTASVAAAGTGATTGLVITSTGAPQGNYALTATGGVETRPRNIAWNKIIKYGSLA